MAKDLFDDNRDSGLTNEISSSFLNDHGKKPASFFDMRTENRDHGITRELLPEVFCPYLGSGDDRATRLGYPSPWNHCYRNERSFSLAKNTQVNYCFTKEFECCAVYRQEAPEEPPPLLLAWIESVRLWMGNRRLSAKSAHPPQDTGHPQEENRLPQTEIILPLSTISLPETKDTPADQEILLPMTENLIPMEENVLLRSASERTWDKNARPWVKKARPLAVALVVPLLLIVAALVWWPMPGTSIEESTGNAAPLQEIVQPEDHVQSLTTDQSGSIIDSAGETAVEPESSGQPTVSRQIEAPKDRSAPALVQPEAVGDAFDSRIEAEAPAAETEETAEKASGGFRVQIYD